jgi:hypothetical protein
VGTGWGFVTGSYGSAGGGSFGIVYMGSWAGVGSCGHEMIVEAREI